MTESGTNPKPMTEIVRIPARTTLLGSPWMRKSVLAQGSSRNDRRSTWNMPAPVRSTTLKPVRST